MFILFDILFDKLRFIALFVVTSVIVEPDQALLRSFNGKAFLKSLFRSFCFLSVMLLDNITCT